MRCRNRCWLCWLWSHALVTHDTAKISWPQKVYMLWYLNPPKSTGCSGNLNNRQVCSTNISITQSKKCLVTKKNILDNMDLFPAHFFVQFVLFVLFSVQSQLSFTFILVLFSAHFFVQTHLSFTFIIVLFSFIIVLFSFILFILPFILFFLKKFNMRFLPFYCC